MIARSVIAAGLRVALCCLGAAMALTAAQTSSASTEVRVGTTREATPIRSVFHDLVEHIADLEGWKIRWIYDEPGTLRAGVQHGDIDVLAGVSVTGDDALVASHEPVLSTWGQLFVRSDTPIGSVLDLDGRSVAGLDGDPYVEELREIARRFGITCDFVVAATSEAVLTAVVESFVDAGVVERTYGLERASTVGLSPSPVVFAPTEVRFAASETREELIRTLDFHIARMRLDPASVYHQSVAEHLGPEHDGRLPGWLVPASSIASGLIVSLIALNMVLRRRVTSTSRQLEAMDTALADEIRTRRGTEEALLRFTTVIEQMVEGVAIASPDGCTIDVNPAFEQLTGRVRADAIGAPLLELFQPPYVEVEFEAFRAALSAGQPWRGRFTAERMDGREYTVETTLAPISDETSEQPTLLCIVRDITEESRLASQLRQAQKLEALGTLAGGIAHDFNNTLGSMMGYAELTMLDLPPSSAQHEQLEQVLIAGERARSLIEQILTFSRRSDAALVPFRLQPIVKETLTLLRSTVDTSVELVSEINTRDLIVTTDPTQIQQILMNLCANAVHAIGKGRGTVTVDLDHCTNGPTGMGPCACLSVSDTGCGMTADVVERIFEPFFTSKPIGEGTGMGLAVVHGIVEGHGGTIEVESTLGEGSVFRVYLPLSAHKPEETVQQPQPVLPLAHDEQVMVVDDNPSVARAVSALLQRLGFECRAVLSPHEALEEFAADPSSVDLVITDLAMPKMTGPELATRLRALRPDLPILLLTGHARELSNEQLASAGVDRLLMKPVRSDQLALAIHELLHSSKAPVGDWLDEATERCELLAGSPEAV